jgi:hypothetical protein
LGPSASAAKNSSQKRSYWISSSTLSKIKTYTKKETTKYSRKTHGNMTDRIRRGTDHSPRSAGTNSARV